MNRNCLYRALIVQVLCLFFIPLCASAQGNCDATTLEQFFECYGGKSAFSTHSVNALTTFIQAEDAIEAGQYEQAKALMDNLYKQYPVGDKVWQQVWNAPNGAFVGSPNGYCGLRMMEDIVAYGLNPNPNVAVKKVNMNIVVVGCSQGIQPTTKAELQNGTGPFVTHSLNPKIKENNYRIVEQSMELFAKYVNAITNGVLELHVGIIELDTLCLPVKVTSTKPYNASGDYYVVLNALTKAARDTTDWFLITYPSHVPDFPVFNDESFVAGGMGSDAKGGPVFIFDDKWIIRKPAHLGKGNYSDIERRIYLPQWFQHEFFHHLYRIYPELKLEVKGHDWFERNFWASDFVGEYETDYYSESLHKRLQRDCVPLAKKLITRIGDRKPEFTMLSMNELLGAYSLDKIQNEWNEGEILADGGKYYWKNKANRRWEVTPKFTEGRLTTGADCPYPGEDFFIELYQSADGEDFPGVVSLRFDRGIYKKRFGMMRQSIPIEICLGLYERVPNNDDSHEGRLIKTEGNLLWQNIAGESWSLTPNTNDEYLQNAVNSPTPDAKFQLINVTSPCGIYTLGFNYLGYYYWKPKRSLSDASPMLVDAITDLELRPGFGSNSIPLEDVFNDIGGGSLMYFVTSKDTAIITAKIENQTLHLKEKGEGSTTVYVMAVDNNGGLAVDEFDVKVAKSSSIHEQSSTTGLTLSTNLTNDAVTISGLPRNSRLKLVSVEGREEAIPLFDTSLTINVRHLSSGMYFLICTDAVTGKIHSEKIFKY